MGVLLADTCLADTAVLVLTIIGLLYYWATANYSYWQKRGVKTVSKITPLLGSIADTLLLRRQFALHFQDLYQELEGERFGGYYKMREPALLIRDPELIKLITIKDFGHFVDNDVHVSEKNDPMFAYNVFSMKGGKWKYARSKVSPAFSTGKIRNMFPLIVNVTKELQKNLQRKIDSKNDIFEAKDLAANFTTDVVGSCAFAVNCNSLLDENNEFRNMGKELLSPSSTIQQFTIMLVTFAPSLCEFLGLKFVQDKITDFFRRLVTDAITIRETQGVVRNDFIQLLTQLKNEGSVREDAEDVAKKTKDDTHLDTGKTKIEFTQDVLAAQALGFFADGFETSSITLSFAMHELAMNQEVQDRLRNELRMSLEKFDGELDHDAIRECPYLGNVIAETLRLYPPGGVLNKTCTQQYQIPDSKVTLNVGTSVTLPVHALHHDPKYFPNPETFDPDRFSEENKKNIVPFSYLPFGEGPRQCIGMRFGLAQIKAALATIVLNFQLLPCEKTEHPVQFSQSYFMPISKNGLYMRVAPLSKSEN